MTEHSDWNVFTSHVRQLSAGLLMNRFLMADWNWNRFLNCNTTVPLILLI